MTKTSKLPIHLFVMCLMFCLWSTGRALAEEQQPSTTGSPESSDTAGDKKDTEYHTPLAGEPFETVFMGRKVDVPLRDRGHVNALTLGATFYSPKQGDTTYSPIGAFYLKRVKEEWRTRNTISIFVNDLEYDRTFGNLELVTRFENYTIPGGQTIVLDNVDLEQTSVEWGTLFASVGPGLRYGVHPFQVDNDVRLQLLGRVGYFYVKPTSDTDPAAVLPPGTWIYGGKLRGRYDGMRRNLLELPHRGLATGFDLDYMHRNTWADFGSPTLGTFSKDDTQNYLQFSGYAMGVGGIPGMSEKNRIFASVHGGITNLDSVDRFNSFRIGGGPLPGESDDLYRPDYPGTMFNEIMVANYLLTAVEYRRELTFFMYLHMRGSFIWAKQAALTNPSPTGQFIFQNNHGQAATIGLDSGFLWNSEIYLAYSWDSGFIRNGESGSGLILTWNKSF